MHLIPRRRMRRVLVLLMAMSGLLAVPALAFAHSDLSLVKVVDHAQAAPGDLLTYTIVIQNHGTHANAQGTMTDTLPPHTTFVSATNGCAAAAGVITCPVAPLAVGSSISITITVRVDDDVPAGTLRNVADVTAPGDTPTTTTTARRSRRSASPASATSSGGIRITTGCRAPASRASAASRCTSTTPPARSWARRRPTPTASTASTRLRPGTTYAVCLDNPADSAAGGPLAGFELTVPNAGSDDSIDSDGELRNGVPCIASAPTGAAGSFIPTYDFGFWKPAAIGDRVWEDTNHNGIQDAGEHGVGGVGVALHDSSGATIAHAVTDANGLYLFDRLPPGTYNVCFEVGTIPSGFSLTTKDAPGSTRANGSDAGADGCAVSTVLAPGQRDLDWDAGIWKAPRLRRWSGPSTAREGQPEADAQEGRQARDRARRRGDPLHARRHERRQGDRARREGLRHAPRRPDGDLDGRRQALGRPGLLDGRSARQGQAPAVHAAREGRPDAARGRDQQGRRDVRRHAAAPARHRRPTSRSRAAATGWRASPG